MEEHAPQLTQLIVIVIVALLTIKACVGKESIVIFVTQVIWNYLSLIQFFLAICSPACFNGGTCELVNSTFSYCNCSTAFYLDISWEGRYCEIRNSIVPNIQICLMQ